MDHWIVSASVKYSKNTRLCICFSPELWDGTTYFMLNKITPLAFKLGRSPLSDKHGTLNYDWLYTQLRSSWILWLLRLDLKTGISNQWLRNGTVIGILGIVRLLRASCTNHRLQWSQRRGNKTWFGLLIAERCCTTYALLLFQRLPTKHWIRESQKLALLFPLSSFYSMYVQAFVQSSP